MRQVLSSGYLKAEILVDEFEGNPYKRLRLYLDSETIEEVKLKSDASYTIAKQSFTAQAKNNK